MSLSNEHGDATHIADVLGRMADGFGQLVTQHVALAKLEIAEDARAVAKTAGGIALFVPFVLLGYALLMGAVVVGVSPWTGWALAFVLVGGVHFVGGLLGLVLAIRRMKPRAVMAKTVNEFQHSAASLASAVAPSELGAKHARP